MTYDVYVEYDKYENIYGYPQYHYCQDHQNQQKNISFQPCLLHVIDCKIFCNIT